MNQLYCSMSIMLFHWMQGNVWGIELWVARNWQFLVNHPITKRLILSNILQIVFICKWISWNTWKQLILCFVQSQHYLQIALGANLILRSYAFGAGVIMRIIVLKSMVYKFMWGVVYLISNKMWEKMIALKYA